MFLILLSAAIKIVFSPLDVPPNTSLAVLTIGDAGPDQAEMIPWKTDDY